MKGVHVDDIARKANISSEKIGTHIPRYTYYNKLISIGSTLAEVSRYPSRLQGDQPGHFRKHPYFLSTRHRESSQGHTRLVGRINRPFNHS